MSSQEFELLKARVQGLANRIDNVQVVAGNQEQRSFEVGVNSTALAFDAVRNPMIEDLDANNFDVENIKDFSATNGKFISLKVGDNVITGGSATFIGLTDTPPEFDNAAGKTVKVNAAGNALEFVNSSSVSTFIGLTDTPANFNNAAGKTVKVNTAGNALVYEEAGQSPPTVANPTAAASGSEKPGLGVNVKDLVDSGVHLNWTPVGDAVYGTGQYTQMGGDDSGPIDDDNAKCIAISNDGKYIVVGAPRATFSGNEGYIELYKYMNGNWIQFSRRTGPALHIAQAGGDNNDRFGYSVAINKDAGLSIDSKAIIVAVGAINQGGNAAGAVHVFKYAETYSGQPTAPSIGVLAADDADFANITTSTTALTLNNGIVAEGTGSQRVGVSVALNNDGTKLAFGSLDGEAVKIYRRRSASDTSVDLLPTASGAAAWTAYQTISFNIPNRSGGSVATADLGFSLAFNTDGTKLAVTSQKDLNTHDDGSGFIKVYTIDYSRDGDGGSSAAHSFNGGNQDALEGSAGDTLAHSVQISDDGNIIAVGSPRREHVKIFSTNGSTWSQLGHTITPTSVDLDGNGTETLQAHNNTFGSTVGMNSTGDMIVIGCSEAGLPYVDTGFVRVFTYDDTNYGSSPQNTLRWNQTGQTIFGISSSGSGMLGSRAGRSVAMTSDGNIIAVTSPGDSDPRAGNNTIGQPETNNGNNHGAARVYHLTASLAAINIRRLATFLNYFTT